MIIMYKVIFDDACYVINCLQEMTAVSSITNAKFINSKKQSNTYN